MALVSILIPAYNAERWIAQTIESALWQSWPDKEVIVVNDGSMDRTASIARSFNGVRVVSQPNRGASAARNKAISLCSGDYIQWLDADDVLTPRKIELQLKEATDPQVLLSSAFGSFFYRTSTATFVQTSLWEDLPPSEWLMRKMEQSLWVPPCVWLVSRELTEAAGPWDTGLTVDDDGDYFTRVMLKSSRIHYVASAKSYYRRSGVSSLSYIGNSEAKMASQWRSLKQHAVRLLDLEDTPRSRAACIAFWQSGLQPFYPHATTIVEEMRAKMAELGGELATPKLSWKYGWIRLLLGWKAATYARRLFPLIRFYLVKAWDRILLWLAGDRCLLGARRDGDAQRRTEGV